MSDLWRSDLRFSSVSSRRIRRGQWKWNASGRTLDNWTNDRGVRRHGTVFFNLLIHAPRARTCEDHIYMSDLLGRTSMYVCIYMYIIYIYGESTKKVGN